MAEDPGLLQQDPAAAAETIVRQAEELYGVHFVPPDGGHDLLSKDGKNITHSIYGSQIEPRQQEAPSAESAAIVREFSAATAELTFLRTACMRR